MRDRIEAVGGTLTLDAAPGGGARVSARVPAVPVDRPAGG
jgi:signal transduction histidine kinase